MGFLPKDRYSIEDLLSIMELLRSENGCPWDREQTHDSIRKNLIEETYEVAEAIDAGNADLLKEELGDLLLQVVFHSQMEREQGRFDFADVCDGICKKLVLRHPHIFAGVRADTSEQVLSNWEDIKKSEKKLETHTQSLQNVPRTLPALMRSEKVQSRAARAGFDYPDTDMAMRDLLSEVDELRKALEDGDPLAVSEELGDLLFSVVNVARFSKQDAERALEKATDKFIGRFAAVEELAGEKGIDLATSDIALLDNLWQEAKIKEHNNNFGGSRT